MQFIVTRNISKSFAVESPTAEEAVAQVKAKETAESVMSINETYSVQPRPTPGAGINIPQMTFKPGQSISPGAIPAIPVR